MTKVKTTTKTKSEAKPGAACHDHQAPAGSQDKEAPAGSHDHGDAAGNDQSAAKRLSDKYTCPMCPSVAEDAPGPCPMCAW